MLSLLCRFQWHSAGTRTHTGQVLHVHHGQCKWHMQMDTRIFRHMCRAYAVCARVHLHAEQYMCTAEFSWFGMFGNPCAHAYELTTFSSFSSELRAGHVTDVLLHSISRGIFAPVIWAPQIMRINLSRNSLGKDDFRTKIVKIISALIFSFLSFKTSLI